MKLMKRLIVSLPDLKKKSRVISEKERKIVAYHESGHVIVGYYCDHADTVHKVTIVPRGQAGGYAMMLPKEDRYLATKNELLDRVTGSVGRTGCRGSCVW